MNIRRGIVTRFHSNTLELFDLETREKITAFLRGKFKLQKITPIVGDYVDYSFENGVAKIENILPKRNMLYRPKIANVDQTVLVTCLKSPKVDYLIIDKFLIQVEKNNLNCIIVLNKVDLLTKDEIDKFLEIYSPLYPVILASAKKEIGIEEIKLHLKNKISTFAGMSGVGKSSLLNAINPGLKLRVGRISDKLQRGKHTTTYTELLKFDFGGFVADTPGFAAFEIYDFKPEKLQEYFVEFHEHSMYCGFSDCVHINEPHCGVKEAVENNQISEVRYKNYLKIYNEVEEYNKKIRRKRWK
ncbi:MULTISPECIES: ribosome small subunit-dependent GTPase A [unclassified Marinitoga]|uniref:ribosome small subunit-dependent GTPase A n=1 Tax=unclassified Marinitoga TaxID=2640159 RepID=UPI000640E2C5|nr:ribosome small subunit-dependent GTPase A [Marinitoga sp. 1155]KLO24530.1 ribosome biogenesis GTPase RsgA [Marinitoga sp. 1155]NUU99419.1 ribosome biogenesis GTPase RsgA [Marinitoga sp. 1154]